jgi:hypothetical protein
MVSDEVVLLVRTSSVGAGRKFDEDYSKVVVSLNDTIMDFRMALFNQLHGADEIMEHEYSTDVTINVIGIDSIQMHKVGKITKKDNDMLVSQFVDKFDKETKSFGCKSYFLQMPMNTRKSGGGT